MIHGRNGDGVQDGLCRLRSITESSGTLRFRENATGLNVARATSEAMRDAPAALFSFGCTLAKSGPPEPRTRDNDETQQVPEYRHKYEMIFHGIPRSSFPKFWAARVQSTLARVLMLDKHVAISASSKHG